MHCVVFTIASIGNLVTGKSLSHKTKQPLFHVNNFYKIVDVFQTFLIIFSTKKWEITFLNYFHEYAILLHPNFSVLTGRVH
jgi:hypothetical protein